MADLAFTAPARPALPRALVARRGFERAQREPVRQEGQLAAALEALHVLEEQGVAAVVAAKSPHCLQLLQRERQAPVACLFTPATGRHRCVQGRTARSFFTPRTPLAVRAS